MDFFKVFLGEIKNIKKSKYLIIALIVIMLMPLAYGGLYLAAFWDPYGNTEDIPVAVVNLDKGANRENKSYNFGDELVDNLKGNDSLGWKFVKTVESAEKGVKGDKYFAMVVIPENFTNQLLDVEKGKINKPKVIFETNKKKNYIVGIITDKASDAIEKGIREKTSIKFTELAMDNLSELRDGLKRASDGSTLLKDGISTMNGKMPQLSNGVESLADGANSISLGIGELNNKIPQMVDGTEKLKDGSNQLKSGLSQLSQGMDNLNNKDKGLSAIKSGSDKMKNQIAHQVYNGLASNNDLSNGISQLSNSITQVGQVIDSKNVPISNEMKSSLQRDINNINSLNSILNSIKPNSNNDNSQELLLKLSVILNGANTESSVSSIYVSGKNLEKISDEIKNMPNYSTTESLKALDNNIRTLSQSMLSLDSNLSELKTALSLYQGIYAISDGIGQATNGVNKLQTGVNELYNGSENLYSGLDTMNKKTKEMQNGVGTLYEGSLQLKEGAQTLSGKIPELKDGLDKLYDGSDKLNSNLLDGEKRLSDKLVTDKEKMSDFVSKPVNMDNTSLYDVDKYGVGLAPNFVSLGLWMGALMLFFIINDKVDDSLGNVKASSVMLGKYLFCCIIGVFQAILLSLAVMKLGLHPPNILSYMGFNIFLSWVFISISMTLVFLFGDIGRLGVVIMLLLQLTSSGGTFPKELLPGFFKNANPLLPFTYSISALRELGLGPDKMVVRKDILILSIILIGFLGLGVIMKQREDNIKESI